MPGEYDDLIPDQPLRQDIRQRESGGRDLPPQANMNYNVQGPRHSEANSDYQIQPGTWRDWTKEFGIGQQYPLAYQAPAGVRDAVAAMALKKYGPNDSRTWQASGPYKQSAPQKKGGEYDDLIPKGEAAKTGTYDDLIPKTAQWRVPPANEGPRENVNLSNATDLPQRPTGPMDPSIVARTPQPQTMQTYLPGFEFTKKLAKPEQWAQMAADPANPMWQRIALATMEEGKRVDSSVINSATVFGDVAKGKASMMDPDTQKRVLDAAGWFGARPTPGGMQLNPSSIADHVAAGTRFEPAMDDSVVATPAERRGEFAPVSAGAAAVPVHEILAENVRNREASLAAADPTLKQKMRAAGNAMKSITAPETIRDVETGEQTGQEAAATIRKFKGRMEREQQIGAQALNQYYKMFDDVSPSEGLTVLKWLQDPKTRGEGGYVPTPDTEGFMRVFSDQMVKVRRLMESLPKTEQAQFKENYVTQMWKDPHETMGRLNGMAPKGGSSYFTKKSVWDSYEDGIRQGGIPLTTNPLEIGVRYLENSYRWLAENQILDEGAESGRIVWRNPANAPKGWLPLKGRAEYYKGPEQKAYAPAPYAQVYNNYVSTLPQGSGGDLLRGIQRASNITTIAKLGLSWFHAGLMANESMASGFANAIDKLAGGDIIGAIGKTAEAPVYPLSSIGRAKEAIKSYLDPAAGSIQMQKAVNALVDANFRMTGKGNIADEYRASFLPDYWDSLKKGRLKMEATQSLANISKHPVLGTGRAIYNMTMRGLETATAPVFQYMVPRLKTGAAVDMMMTFMKRMPDATDQQLADYARRVSNIIDDRFGEMQQDNIFLHKMQKAVMQSALVSFSYEYGSTRSAVGAGVDTADLIKGGGWTPRMSYPIGLAMSMAVSASIYQYLMTGKAPSGVQDLKNPQTGGTDPKSGKPGRAVLPSQLNQVFNALNDPLGEASGKINELWKTVYGLVSMMSPTSGYDYKGDPLVNKNAPGIDQFAQGLGFAAQNFNPMYLSTPRPEGSAIPEYQRYLGVRDASGRATDPENYSKSLRYVNAEKAVTKKQHDGELPRYLPHEMKRKYIQQEMNRYGGLQ